MGLFRELSEDNLSQEEDKATEQPQDKEEKGMSDFEDANVDKDILSEIFGDTADQDGKETDKDDLFADSGENEEKDKENEVVQTELSDLLQDEEEKQETTDEESSQEEELSVEDILKAAREEEEPSQADSAAESEPEEKKEETPAKKKNSKSSKSSHQDSDVTVITKGTTINGGISSDGSLEIMGTITGDVECLGKVSVCGTISGNVSAADVVVDTKKLEGNIISEGSIEVASGTVVIGDICGTSATIAGAVKGNVDVNGPVIIDSTAIVKGSIKAKSIQVNTGAVVDGYCSLNYAGVDLDEFFEEK
jgi:cytoskeletal protein CcmA (bactofilin family)